MQNSNMNSHNCNDGHSQPFVPKTKWKLHQKTKMNGVKGKNEKSPSRSIIMFCRLIWKGRGLQQKIFTQLFLSSPAKERWRRCNFSNVQQILYPQCFPIFYTYTTTKNKKRSAMTKQAFGPFLSKLELESRTFESLFQRRPRKAP